MHTYTYTRTALSKTNNTCFVKWIKSLLIMISAIFISSSSFAQLTGTKNIPGDYATLADAITDLNTQGVGGGGVTFNLVAGNPQTAPAGGYIIGGTGSAVLTTSSAANPVVFEGNGNTITAGLQTANALNDAIFKLKGADYITLQNFVMVENAGNTTTSVATNTMTEWAVALLYASATDGSQNNTILNNNISLNRTYVNSWAVYSNVRHIDGPTAADVTTAADITNATTAPNSGNKVYGNTISNVNLAIAFIGSATAANHDIGNDVGGSSLTTGNTITNFSGSPAATAYVSNITGAYGILMNHQKATNVSYNSLTSASVSVAGTMLGIYVDYLSSSPTGTFTNNITNNTLTLSNSVVGTFQIQAIRHSNTAAVANANATANINSNSVINTNISGAATGVSLFGVLNTAAFGTVNLNSNIVAGMTSTATTAGMVAVTNQGAVVNTININNNQVGTVSSNAVTFSAATSGALTLIFNSQGAATAALSMSGNSIRGIVHSVQGSSAHTYVANTAATLSQNISNNTFNNLNVNTIGSVTFISNSITLPANGVQTVNNNFIVTAFNKGGAGGTVTVYSATATPSSPSTASHTATGNNFSNITVTGATALVGWSNQEGAPGPAKVISNNTFSNWTGGTSAINAIITNWSGANSSITGNTISNITGQGAITGILRNSSGGAGVESITNNTITSLSSTGVGGNVIGISGGASGISVHTISGNTISGLSSTGASSTITGINILAGTTVNVNDNNVNSITGTGITSPLANGVVVAGGTTVNLNRNKICNIAQNGAISTTSPAVNGMSFSGGTTVNAFNNLIGDLRAPAASLANAIRGISVTSTTASTSYNVYYNTVYLDASSTGATFGTSGIFHSASATATTGKLDLRNNIIANNSTPGTAGVVSAIRRSAAATYGNYAPTSNNNLLYAGTPAANRAILDDNGTVYGTAGASFAFGPAATAGTFQNQVAPRESVSFSEVVSPSAGVFFQSITCGDPNFLHLVPAIVTQVESGAQVIAGITTDFDNNTRSALTPDVGADEFSGTSPAPVFSNVTVPAYTCTPTAHIINADVTTISGTITSVVLNYNNGSAGSVPMTLVSGDTYTGTIPAGSSGVTVTWSISATNSLPLSSTFNGVSYKDDPLFGLTVTANATVNPVCSGSPSVLSVNFSGGATPSYTAPPAVTNPTTDEDFGNITITQGITTILNNTTTGGSLVGTIGTASGTPGGYSNFTAFGPYVLNPGTTYNISLTSITQGGNFGNALAAWIDYNRDGDFADAGEEIYNQGATILGPHTSTGSFTVPSGASYGGSRLRVLVNEGTISGPTITPSWGEYEEYAINLMPAITAYAWSDGISTISTNSSVTVNPTSNTNYTVTVTSLSCDATSAPLAVNVTALPSAPTTAPSTQCGTGVPTCFAVGTGNGNYRWYLTPTGGTAIPGEVNDVLGSYSISTTTTFYVAISDGTCESERTPVIATVTNPDAVTAAVNNNNPCANVEIQLSASQTGNTNTYVYTWTASPETGSGITGSVGGSPALVTPTAGGTYVYTVTAVDAGAGCTTTSTVSVTVKDLPTISTVTASPNPICEGTTTVLTATKIGGFIGTNPVGTSTTTTQAGSPFRAGGAAETRTQILYTAAELLAAGFTPGNFSSIAYNFTTASGGTLPNFRIKMGHTAVSALTSTFEASPGTSVFGPVPVNPNTITGLQTLTFSAPFTWNGTSNVLLEICHDVPSPSAGSGQLSANSTAFTSVNQVLGAGACGVLTTGTTQTVRPIAIFGQSGNDITSSYNWVWNPGALSGSTVTTPVINTSTTFTVTITDPVSTCSNTGSVLVNVNPLPPAPSATTSEQCGTAVPTASVSSGSSEPTPFFRWYLVASGGSPVQSGTSTTYTSSISTTTTFYVAEVSAAGCEGPRTAVLATVNEPDPVVASATATTICLGANFTLALIQIGETNTYEYTWSASPEAGSGFTGTQTGVNVGGVTPTLPGVYTYTVVAFDAERDCSTTSSVTVTVNAVPTEITASASNTSVCAGSTINLTSFANSNTYNSTVYTQGFETFPPAGWTFINAGTSPNQWAGLTNALFPGAAHTGNAAMYYNWDASNAANAWAFTPAQTLAAGQTYTLKFWYNTTSIGGVFPEKMKVTVGNNNTVAAQTTILWNNNGGANLTNEVYAQATVTYTPVTSGTYYFAFHCYSDADNNFMFVDDVEISGNTPIAPTYSWTSSPSGFTSSLQNPTNVVVNQTTTYSVVATNSLGCASTPATVTVTAIPLPAAPIGTDSEQCGLGVPTASVSTGGANGTFLWYDAPTGGTLLQTGGSTYTTAINTTTTFYVAESDGTCESLRTAVTVTVNQPDPVTASSSLSSVCVNGNIQLSATQTGSTNTYVYTWTANPSTGSGIAVSSVGNPVTVTPTAAGSYIYTVTAVDAGAGCTTTSTVTVTVNPNPVIDSIRATPNTICEGGIVSLSVYSSAPVSGPQSLPGTYCNPIQTGSANITSVTFNTLSNTSITQVSPFYDIYPASGNTTTTVSAGATYSLAMVTSGASIASVWIDYNRDGNFDPAEWTQVWTAASSGSVNITIPANATAGLTGMRIRTRLTGNANGSGDACTSFGSGVAQDYSINIVGLTTQNPAFTYTWNPGGLNGSTVSVSPAVSTNYTVTILNSSTGCSAVSDPVSVTVTPVVAAATATPSTPVCAGTAVVLNANATGGAPFTYSWSDGVATVGNTASITVNPTVTTTYTVTVTDACSNQTTSQVTVTVNPLPTASIAETGPISICSPLTQTLTAVTSTANPTYQWRLNGVNIPSATASTYLINTVSNGAYTVVVTETSTGCSNTSAAVNVEIKASPVNVLATASSATVCLGSTIDLTASADAPLPIVLASQNFENGLGSWTTTNNSGGSTPTIVGWEIKTNPFTSANSTPVTFNSGSGTSFLLSNPDLGGSGTTVNALLTSPTFSTIGMSSMSLSLKHYYRLFTSGEATIEVSTDGGTNWTTAKTYTATAGTPAAFVTDNTNLDAFVGFANVQVRISYIDGWSWYWAVDDIAVTATPSSFSYSWTSSPSGFTSSVQNPTGVAPTVNTTYTVVATAANGCSTPASTVEVVVNPRPTAVISGTGTFCQDAVNTSTNLSIAFTGTGPWNYTVSGSDGSNTSGTTSSNPATVTVTPGSATPGVITYTVSSLSDDNCAANAGDLTGSATVTINPSAAAPTANVIQPTCAVATGSITMTAPLGTGNSYTLDGTTTITWPSVTFSGVASGPHTITVTNSFGCSAPASLNVTIDPQPIIPAAPVVTGPTNVCPYIGTAEQITFNATSTGATSYTWTLPPNVSVVSGQGTGTLVVTFANGFASQANKQIRVVASSICGTSAQTIYYLLAQFPSTPGTISGPVDACPLLGSSANYSVPPVPGASSYIWTAQPGTTITFPNGGGINGYTVNIAFPTGFTTSAVTVQAVNDCGPSGIRSLTITRNSPSVPSPIAGPTNVCANIAPGGTAATYTVTNTPGVTYNWTVPVGAIGLTGQGTNSISFTYPIGFTSGNISVVATTGCGTSLPRSLSVNKLNPGTPSVIDVINTQTCPNREFTYTVAGLPVNATSIQWTIPSNGILVSGQGTVSITVQYPATAVDGFVTAQAVNNCGASVIRSVTVKLAACPPPPPFTKGVTEVIAPVETMEVKVFPNPTVSDFKLQVITAGKEEISVRVLDVQGRFIRQFTATAYQTINLGAELKAGAYLIEVRQGKQVKTTRVLKF
ncbi:MAG: GEVED domain-containing protein [Ferruginibacter sp.]